MNTSNSPSNLLLWLLLGASIGFIVMAFWLLAELDRWFYRRQQRRRAERRGGYIR